MLADLKIVMKSIWSSRSSTIKSSTTKQWCIRDRTHVRVPRQPPRPRSSEAADATNHSRKATGYMYLADPKPWVNSKVGREILREEVCFERMRGGPFIGERGHP